MLIFVQFLFQQMQCWQSALSMIGSSQSEHLHVVFEQSNDSIIWPPLVCVQTLFLEHDQGWCDYPRQGLRSLFTVELNIL